MSDNCSAQLRDNAIYRTFDICNKNVWKIYKLFSSLPLFKNAPIDSQHGKLQFYNLNANIHRHMHMHIGCGKIKYFLGKVSCLHYGGSYFCKSFLSIVVTTI